MSAYGDEHLQYDHDGPVAHPPALLSRTSLGTSAVTRTVAIIKTHALNRRFEIERRIQEASFEVRLWIFPAIMNF
jgi:hypothetical protein